jgi:hypothetical protein
LHSKGLHYAIAARSQLVEEPDVGVEAGAAGLAVPLFPPPEVFVSGFDSVFVSDFDSDFVSDFVSGAAESAGDPPLFGA